MKFKFVKPVRFRGEDKKVNDVIDIIEGGDEYVNLMQVEAIEKYVEEEVEGTKETKEIKETNGTKGTDKTNEIKEIKETRKKER